MFTISQKHNTSYQTQALPECRAEYPIYSVDPVFRPGEEKGGAHPGFERAEGVFGCTSPYRHFLRIEIETPLGRFQHRLVLPAFDATHLARRTLLLEGTCRASRCPIE